MMVLANEKVCSDENVSVDIPKMKQAKRITGSQYPVKSLLLELICLDAFYKLQFKDSFHLEGRDFPNAEWMYEKNISLPIYPGMTDEEVDYVIENVSGLCRLWKR